MKTFNQRLELNQFEYDNPYEIVDLFEKTIAEYAGSQYAVAVDCATHGIELALEYYDYREYVVYVPRHTYISVPTVLLRTGYGICFTDEEWYGTYVLDPLPIVDSSVRFTKGMYEKGSTQILSFQFKKRVPIGRGGMILTDSKEEYLYYKKAVYDGRDLTILYADDDVETLGWHYYMTPEDAARGLLLFDTLPEINADTANWENYPDLMKKKVFLDERYHLAI